MPDRNWKYLRTQLIRDYPFVTLREDHYRFERTGVEAPFVVCDSADWVLVIPQTVDHQLVFVRQFRHGVRQVVLEIPGGVVDEGEAPVETARRELLEETGYQADRFRLLGTLLPNPAINSASFHVVLAEGCNLAAAPQWDALEEISVELRPVEGVRRMIAEGELSHALVVAAFALWYAQGEKSAEA